MTRTILTIFTLALFCGCSAIEEDENRVSAGDRVPYFEVIDEMHPDSPPFNTAYIDRPTLIYFFWSECDECKEQTPYIIDIANRYDGEVLNVVCIARGGNNATYDMAMYYWDDVRMNMRPEYMPGMAYDYNRRIYDMFAHSGVPRIYLIDRYGIVDSAYEGFQGDNSTLRSRIDRLLSTQ